MELKKILQERRSYRSLEKTEVTSEILQELALAASLTPSCFNNQPWRYVFITEPKVLEQMRQTLSKGNEWAHVSDFMIAVFSKKELDCVIKTREYHWFDTGMATGFLILRTWDLGLVAHPIAGFDPEKAAAILKIPSDLQLLTLIIVGKKSKEMSPVLTDYQKSTEQTRPERKPLAQIVFYNSYQTEPK